MIKNQPNVLQTLTIYADINNKEYSKIYTEYYKNRCIGASTTFHYNQEVPTHDHIFKNLTRKRFYLLRVVFVGDSHHFTSLSHKKF